MITVELAASTVTFCGLDEGILLDTAEKQSCSDMFDTTTIVVSVVVLLSVFLQPGITAHSIKDSTSEADSSSQLKEGRKFQVKENMRLRDEQENVISAHSEEIQQHKRKSKPLQEKTKKVTATWIGSISGSGHDGIAKVEDKIYVLDHTSQQPPKIRVYENNYGFRFIEDINLKNTDHPNDIIYSNESKNVYISDSKAQSLSVLTTTEEHEVTAWLKNVLEPNTLSLSNEGHLIVMRESDFFDLPNQLEIYSVNATLIRTLQLPEDVRNLQHVVQTSSGNFIISHQLDNEEEQWVLSELANNGSLLKRFLPRNESEELGMPTYLSLDSDNNRLFVADYHKSQVILFDSTDLTWSEVVLPDEKSGEMNSPSRLLYYAEKKRLFVTQDYDNVNVYEIN